MRLKLFLLFVMTVIHWEDGAKAAEAFKPAVRVAVVSGLARSGVWPEIVKRFEKETGRKIEMVTGQRPDVAKALQEGRVDCAVMHSGDVATALVSEGFGAKLQPFARNEYVIIGPASDPAMIKGLTNTAAALKRIATTQSKFVNHEGAGSRELGQLLWEKAGITPAGKWFLDDQSGDEGVVAFAGARNAYVIASRNPKLLASLNSLNLAIMVEGDPLMKRPFLFIEANAQKFPSANHSGAMAFVGFLLSESTQGVLMELGKSESSDRPFLYPVNGKRKEP